MCIYLLLQECILIRQLGLLRRVGKSALCTLTDLSVGSNGSSIILPEALAHILGLILFQHLVKKVRVVEVDQVVGLEARV